MTCYCFKHREQTNNILILNKYNKNKNQTQQLEAVFLGCAIIEEVTSVLSVVLQLMVTEFRLYNYEEVTSVISLVRQRRLTKFILCNYGGSDQSYKS